MKIIRGIPQGSAEWSRLRAGIPTASSFDLIVTPKGAPSKSQEKYMMRLLAERIKQAPGDEFISLMMQRGKDMEVHARKYYQFQNDCIVEQVTFITNDAGTIGCSPDGLVGADGSAEFKSPKDETHMGYLLGAGTVADDYKIQANGILWICERKWVDLVSFCPPLPEAMIHVDRDEAFIKILSSAVEAFSTALETRTLELIARGWIKADWRFALTSPKSDTPIAATESDLRSFNEKFAPVSN